MRTFRLILLLLFLGYISLWSQEMEMAGLLYGKNYYLPYLPSYSFPGFSPRSGQQGEITLSLAYTGINDFTTYDNENRALDYEGSIVDLSLTWRPSDNLLLGVDGRLICYYGGFFDTIIEGWHGFFGLPNSSREYFGRNEIFVDVDNMSGQDLHITTPIISMGDTDLYALWTFYSASNLTLAAAGALKIPTGSLETGSGSEHVDGGVQLLGEWSFISSWTLHFQQGVVFPWNNSYTAFIQSQTFLGLEYQPFHNWSFILQTRINTSPISSDRYRTYQNLGTVPLFTLPQTSIQVGVKKSYDSWGWQIYFEEDPFTYEGSDILFSLRTFYFFK